MFLWPLQVILVVPIRSTWRWRLVSWVDSAPAYICRRKTPITSWDLHTCTPTFQPPFWVCLPCLQIRPSSFCIVAKWIFMPGVILPLLIIFKMVGFLINHLKLNDDFQNVCYSYQLFEAKWWFLKWLFPISIIWNRMKISKWFFNHLFEAEWWFLKSLVFLSIVWNWTMSFKMIIVLINCLKPNDDFQNVCFPYQSFETKRWFSKWLVFLSIAWHWTMMFKMVGLINHLKPNGNFQSTRRKKCNLTFVIALWKLVAF